MFERVKLVWRAYQLLMTKHPWKVQILTSGGLVGFSDIVSQQLVERRGIANHNVKRTVKMTTVGLIYVLAVAPCFLAGFITVTGFLGGLPREKIWLKLQKDYKNTLISNYAIWPTAQLLNFYFIPLEHRLAVVQVVALMWNTYLSWMANRM
ncbi:protein Mpv17 isoform X2 [Pristis pectinata]|uniref:protein Mpv17 isoform X2 n=1 Tax=Pristis pectinata TaxID=685728 RepID=UPI00223CFE52|nr:protein Mpv17 isoform X2 [Pristis pectinata]